MSPKRSLPPPSSSDQTKRKKACLTIHQKVNLLDMLTAGKKVAEVARLYKINESTVRSIRKKEPSIRAAASISFNRNAKCAVTPRNENILKTEAALAQWISARRAQAIPLDTPILQEKAKQLYKEFTSAEETAGASAVPNFVASNGWFAKFCKRYQLTSALLHGEAASADQPSAEKYVTTVFPEILAEGRYRLEQVFNMDETGLLWKRLPSRTFLFKESAQKAGLKTYKDRLTLVMCGNAAGFLLKPALIYKSKNPRALKNKNKNCLPVYWMHQKKSWITKQLTSDWFKGSFVPQVKTYLEEKGLEFKVLLLMDNAGGHPDDLTHEGVRIEYLPPNTTSLIQPMDQGVIRAFKALYVRSFMKHLVNKMDSNEDFSLNEYWKSFTIASCLDNIHGAMEAMKSETVKSSWKHLWPQSVEASNDSSAENVLDIAISDTLHYAHQLEGEGFEDMNRDDVQELLNIDPLMLSEEDLLKGAEDATENDQDVGDEQEDSDSEIEAGLSLERLAQVTRLVREAQAKMLEWDPNMDRALRFQCALDSAIGPYKTLLSQMKKERSQLPITMFIDRTSRVRCTTDIPSRQEEPEIVISDDDEAILSEED